jgi:hypothetical protein
MQTVKRDCVACISSLQMQKMLDASRLGCRDGTDDVWCKEDQD